METTNSIRRQKLTVITLGQANHGKATLTSAIMAISAKRGFAQYWHHSMADQTNDATVKGIIIKRCVLNYLTLNKLYEHYECANDTDDFKTLIVDDVKFDGAILVVDATAGATGITTSQIFLARQTGIPKIVVYLNKVDMVTDNKKLEQIETVLMAVLKNHGFGDSPIVRGSALGSLNGDAQWIDTTNKLLEVLDSFIQGPAPIHNQTFLLPIEDRIGITGRGTVATGSIESGLVKVGDEVVVLTNNGALPTIVKNIEVFRKNLESAEAGTYVGLLFEGVQKQAISRGDLVVSAKNKMLFGLCTQFNALVYFLTEREVRKPIPISPSFNAQIYFRTSKTTGNVTLTYYSESIKGNYSLATIELANSATITKGLSFSIYEGASVIAHGKVIEMIS